VEEKADIQTYSLVPPLKRMLIEELKEIGEFCNASGQNTVNSGCKAHLAVY
jgi:hypothetical protein